jgi:phage tail-like protein
MAAPTAPIVPAQTMHFGVILFDMQGPLSRGGDAGLQAGLGIVSGAIAMLSDILMLGFRAVDGLGVDLEIEDYAEGGADYSPHRLRKGQGAHELTFKRGVTGRTDLWDWHQQVLRGTEPVMRKSGVVILFDRNSYQTAQTTTDTYATRLAFSALNWIRVPIAAWYFHNGLPKTVTGPALNTAASGDDQIAIEQLTIAHEGLTRVSLASIPGLADAGTAFGGLLGNLTGGLSAVGQSLGPITP